MQQPKIQFVSSHTISARKYLERFRVNDHKALLPSQANVLLAFDKENKLNDLSEITRKNYITMLSRFAKIVQKPFEQMTKNDIMDGIEEITKGFNPGSAQRFKINLKKFFKFIYSTDEYPEVVKWIKTNISKRHREPKNAILTYEERTKLLTSCKNQRDRAILTFLDQTGCRAQELVLTRNQDISLGENDAYLTIKLGQGKTGRRKIVITEGISEIILWMNIHPHKHDPDAPLFISFQEWHKYKKLGTTGLNTIITNLQNHAKIQRSIYPHIFRHTRATIAGKIWRWNEARMRVFFGWTRTSNMPAYYTHINDDDVIELSLMDAGLKNKKEIKATEIEDRECPRCKKKNPFDSKYCNFCSLILDQDVAARNAKVVRVTDAIMDISQEQEIPMPEAVKRYIDAKIKDLNAKN